MKKKFLLFCLATILFSNIGGFARAAQCGKLCNIDFWPNASLADVKNALAHADVNARDKDGWTPLHYAATLSETPAIVDLLLASGAKIDARDKDGLTPLHFAAGVSKTPAIIDLLLAHGADVRAKTKEGETAFDLVKKNEKLQNTDAYWQLHEAQYQ